MYPNHLPPPPSPASLPPPPNTTEGNCLPPGLLPLTVPLDPAHPGRRYHCTWAQKASSPSPGGERGGAGGCSGGECRPTPAASTPRARAQAGLRLGVTQVTALTGHLTQCGRMGEDSGGANGSLAA